MEGLDARGRSLGSLGIALPGFSFYRFDPAGAAGTRAPLIGVSMQPTWGTLTQADVTQNVQATRFPHLAIAYPFNESATVLFTYSGVLDQRWRMEDERQLPLAGESVTVVDEFVTDGGLSVVDLGWAQRIGERFAVGGMIGFHTGGLRRQLTRTFDATELGTTVDPFSLVGSWKIGGPALTVSARWEPSEIVRVGLGVEWAGTLDITPTEGTNLGAQTAKIPTKFRLGASGRLSPALSLVGGVSYADWEGTPSGLAAAVRTSAEIIYGLGLEFTGLGLLDREMPLRLGYRHTDYPYQFEQADAAESLLAFGLGYVFASLDGYALASLDMAAETGKRTAGGLEESFWRATFSLRLSGN